VGSFKYFGMNQETQLKNILYEGGIFEVYFYAKNKIPKGSFVATDFNEIYGYNDYFSLMGIYREARTDTCVYVCSNPLIIPEKRSSEDSAAMDKERISGRDIDHKENGEKRERGDKFHRRKEVDGCLECGEIYVHSQKSSVPSP
jgi:hypothetical protein